MSDIFDNQNLVCKLRYTWNIKILTSCIMFIPFIRMLKRGLETKFISDYVWWMMLMRDGWWWKMDDDDGRWMMMMGKKVEQVEKTKVVGDALGTIGGVRMALQKFDSNENYHPLKKNKKKNKSSQSKNEKCRHSMVWVPIDSHSPN